MNKTHCHQMFAVTRGLILCHDCYTQWHFVLPYIYCKVWWLDVKTKKYVNKTHRTHKCAMTLKAEDNFLECRDIALDFRFSFKIFRTRFWKKLQSFLNSNFLTKENLSLSFSQGFRGKMDSLFTLVGSKYVQDKIWKPFVALGQFNKMI